MWPCSNLRQTFPQKRPTVTGSGTFVQSTFIRPCLNFEPVTHIRVANTFELHHTYIIRRDGVNCRNNRDRRLKVRIPNLWLVKSYLKVGCSAPN